MIKLIKELFRDKTDDVPMYLYSRYLWDEIRVGQLFAAKGCIAIFHKISMTQAILIADDYSNEITSCVGDKYNLECNVYFNSNILINDKRLSFFSFSERDGFYQLHPDVQENWVTKWKQTPKHW